MPVKPSGRPFWISLALLLAAVVLSVGVGSVFIPPGDLLRILVSGLAARPLPEAIPASFVTILISLRLPRTLLVALTGAALSGSGAAYQGLFRNPLADPYLIGVASGGGLGAVLAMTIHWPYTWWGLIAIPIAAFCAAVLTVALVYQLARVGRAIPTTNLILAGVAISSFATAVTSFLMLTSTRELHRAVAWLLGGSTLSGWGPVLAMLPYALIGLATLVALSHPLNVLQFGDEQAQQLGLPVQRVRFLIVAAATLTTAAAVSFSGIIGFVGLIVPHLIRLLWGGDYRRLLPLAVLNGATFLLVADILARILMAPQEIPVGIITALGGAPFFLWILRHSRQQYAW
ncbi:MAG: iron ABC transporter permease [Anaerolineaceae bacterium]|nr:iron ABC transporter permease [Anaerolineaceae bacterium]